MKTLYRDNKGLHRWLFACGAGFGSGMDCAIATDDDRNPVSKAPR